MWRLIKFIVPYAVRLDPHALNKVTCLMMKNIKNHEDIHIEAAPLAGYTDRAFRRVLAECGAKIIYTEMISATALVYGNEKTFDMIKIDKQEGVTNVVQLFGNKPEHFAKAIQSGVLDEFDEININMGCPAKKIVQGGEGSALMLDMSLAKRIIEVCVGNTNIPITVKMRLGYHPVDRDVMEGDQAPVMELAKICEEVGAKKIIVHGRVQAQGFNGVADWHAIARVVKLVSIPVIANGDITNMEKAKECLSITGAAGVMIGRAIIGAPWNITLSETPPEDEVKRIIKLHLVEAQKHNVYMPELRKQLLQYFNHIRNSKELKLRVVKVETYEELFALLDLEHKVDLPSKV